MHEFWDNQSWATGLSTQRVKKTEQQKLPEDFEWSSHSLDTIYKFLKENYVSDDDFKLRYTIEEVKNIFQKNQKDNNDIFYRPIDIGDNTIPNGNAIMLINLIRLGLMDESKNLADSLNGYLNIYKNHMMTAIRALDFFNNIRSGKNCNEQGCKIND